MPDRDRVARAFRDDDAFDPAVEPGAFDLVTTPFDATVRATDGREGTTRFEVVVRAPTLSVATPDDVAPVVEEGWYETFELRVADPSGVTREDRDLDPTVRTAGDEVVVEMAFDAADPRTGVADARALANFVEGTYVQGVIPGYEYEDPVASLLDAARRA